jgi:predicted regulator of Ras-like GTPase activity (Roadblock/LC7/MglB family)
LQAVISICKHKGGIDGTKPAPLGIYNRHCRDQLSLQDVLKMLNFFKNLFGSSEAETHARGNGNGNGHGYAAATATPAAPVQVHARPVVPQQKPQPPQRVQPPMPAAQAHSFSQTPANGNGVNIPLHTIIAVLPLELKTRIQRTMVADIVVALPLDRVLIQLGSGVVRLSFGELRALAPNVFSELPDLDQSEIALPLNEILPQINPSLLARRQSQKQMLVPEDIHGPFGTDLAGVALADPRTAAKPIAAAPAPMAAPKAPPVNPVPMNPIPMKPAALAKPAPMVPPTLVKPVPMAPPAAARPAQPISPIAPAQPLKPAQPVPFKPAAPAPANDPDPIPMVPFRSSITSTPTPRAPMATPPAAPPVRPVLPASRGVSATPLPAAASRLPANLPNNNGRAASVPNAPQAIPAGAAAQEASLSIPLRMLSEAWPEVLRSEIQQLNLTEAAVALPVRFVEPALKQGKVAFTWKVLRSWIRPATLPTVSAHDGMMLELPLRVIAPLFLARHKQGATPHQKVEVDENIPNLFFGFPQGESAAATLEQQQPAPVGPSVADEEPEANFAPAVKGTNPADTNFYTWNESTDAPQVDASAEKKTTPGTDFLTRYATPNEVVSRAAALDGVAGALVALPDGLMVASKLSADLNGDTLAAFLPHIFGKVSQCTKELRMGELNNLHFTVGNVPWKIFRVNAIFFAAFGHAGQPLPTGQLAALAGELDRRK